MPSLATHVADGRSAAEGAMTSAEVGERVRSAALVAGDRRGLALSLVASARPVVTQIPVLAGLYGADEQYAVSASVLSMLVMFVTIPVIMMLL